jgi:hypothetical protein
VAPFLNAANASSIAAVPVLAPPVAALAPVLAPAVPAVAPVLAPVAAGP